MKSAANIKISFFIFYSCLNLCFHHLFAEAESYLSIGWVLVGGLYDLGGVLVFLVEYKSLSGILFLYHHYPFLLEFLIQYSRFSLFVVVYYHYHPVFSYLILLNIILLTISLLSADFNSFPFIFSHLFFLFFQFCFYLSQYFHDSANNLSFIPLRVSVCLSLFLNSFIRSLKLSFHYFKNTSLLF